MRKGDHTVLNSGHSLIVSGIGVRKTGGGAVFFCCLEEFSALIKLIRCGNMQVHIACRFS
ncbi:MAG: hypothetical protein IKM34_06195 [Clostridia bacterium]|nr:hypothetical protein [Clostridia bacterium]